VAKSVVSRRMALGAFKGNSSIDGLYRYSALWLAGHRFVLLQVAQARSRLSAPLCVTVQGLCAFRPEPTDIMITTTPKAGTTWMQQITHQLRTNGDKDFDEISAVVPWLELAHDQVIHLACARPIPACSLDIGTGGV
jgi:hypothetical protein